jgi:hypothetical protein
VSAGKIETLCVGDSCEQCEYTLCHWKDTWNGLNGIFYAMCKVKNFT